MFKKKIIIIGLILVIGICCCFIFDSNLLKDDYYEGVNRDIIDKHVLKESEYTWSTFSVAQEESDKKYKSIIRDIVNKKDMGLSPDKVKNIMDVYESAAINDKRNSIGIGSISSYLDFIMNSNSIRELVEGVISIENDLGIDIFTNMNISYDYQDNRHNIVYFYPVTYAFGSSSDYWVNDDYMAYKAYLKRGIIELLVLYGYDKKEARSLSQEIVSFYEEVSSSSKLVYSLTDITSYYNVVSMNEIGNIYSNIDMDKYLKKRGIGEQTYVSVVDLEQAKVINKYLSRDYLELWKDMILVKVLSCYAGYLSQDYVDVVTQLNNSIMGIDKDEKTREDKAIEIVGNLFSYELDSVYSNKVMTSDDILFVKNMVEDIRKYYGKMLDNNIWLSRETIKRAQDKLDNMKVYIGDSDSKPDYSYSTNDSNLVSNVIAISKERWSRELEKLDKNQNGSSELSQVQVNAYYSPLENAIYIPASIMYLRDNKDSYYEQLGSVGMIVAHEITHGFDLNGSQFDRNGNLSNWWNDKDRDAYMRLKEEVVQYYSGYEVIDGRYINGEKTVNENIADLGALSCITGIVTDKGASNQEMKELFSSFAKMWASKSSSQYMKLLLLQDSHAPNKYRVNAVLSSTDSFYRVYGIRFWDNMYLFKKDRVKVW